MKLYLVRHGETDWNKQKRIQGQVDIPLNAFGRSLAKKTAEGLKSIPFDVCYSSPLGRAEETARLILNGRDVPIITDHRIMEMAFGEYEGKCCSKEGWNLPREFEYFFHDPAHFKPAEGGESFEQVQKRAGEFIEELCGKRQYQESNVLITTHGAALAGILNYIRGGSIEEYWGIGVHKNCAVTELFAADGRIEILSENVVYYDDKVEDWGIGK